MTAIRTPKSIKGATTLCERYAALSAQADAIEAMAITYTVQVQWLQQAMMAILAQLSLTDEQQAQAPLVIAGYLEEHAADVE